MLNRDRLFPALVLGAANPERPLGHGLSVQVFGYRGTEKCAVGPEQLAELGLTADEAFARALNQLREFADESPDLSIQILGSPGAAVHALLYSDHPWASACLLLPDLHEHAADALQEADLLACVPQTESLVVFPKRDRAYRESLIAKLREIEADAKHPLTFELFALSANGATPFSE
jgi:hypothetical protein